MAGQQNLGLFIGVRVPVRESPSPRRTLIASRRLVFGLVALLVAPLGLRAQAPPAQPAPAIVERVTRELAPGVVWTQETTPASLPGGPLLVNVVRIEPFAAKNDRLRAALGYGRIWENNATQGRETVSATAARTGALVAVNAGFFTFSSGHPLGIHVENGEPVTEPLRTRTAFCIGRDGKGSVANFSGSGTVTANNGATFPLNGMNRKPGKGTELLLFSPRFFDRTLPVPSRAEVSIAGVKSVRFNETLSGTAGIVSDGGGTSLDPQTVVLSGSGDAARFLRENIRPGETVAVRYDVFPKVDDLRQIIAGGPRLVRGGQGDVTDAAEGFDAGFSKNRHPRTAIGATQTGAIVLLTVDGRQPTLSRGATLAETAALLMKWGAVEGVNWDGGGSTSLAVRGLMVNSPSDGAERPVASDLIFVTGKVAKPMPAATLLTPSASPMPIGASRSLALPLGIRKKDGDTAVWGMQGNVGWVSQAGVFVARRAGSGTVTAVLADGRRFMLPVRVVSDAPAPKPTPTPNPAIDPDTLPPPR